MNGHLTPEEFVDVIERPLPAARQAHLATCSSCAEQLEEMRVMLTALEGAGDVPEPSPLFWDHLSARVRDAVHAEPVTRSWWQVGWRSWVTVASVAVVVVAALTVQRAATPRPAATVAGVETSATFSLGPESDAMWEMIASLAPGMGEEQVVEAGLIPSQDVADSMIASLTDAERRQLVRLLKAEMGSE